MESAEQQGPVQAKPPVPVHPTTGEQIRIIDQNCEFCGVNATKCEHAEAFFANGLVQHTKAMKELQRAYRNFLGLPRVFDKICEFCGVDAVACQHGAERKRLANITPEAPRKRVELDPANGAKIHVKEPESKEVTEENYSGEDAQKIKDQVAEQQQAAAQRDAAPEVSDEDVGDQLEGLSPDQGIGMEEAADTNEDVDVE